MYIIHKMGCNLHVFGATQLVCGAIPLVLRTAVSVRGSLYLPLVAASYQSSLWISLRY